MAESASNTAASVPSDYSTIEASLVGIKKYTLIGTFTNNVRDRVHSVLNEQSVAHALTCPGNLRARFTFSVFALDRNAALNVIAQAFERMYDECAVTDVTAEVHKLIGGPYVTVIVRLTLMAVWQGHFPTRLPVRAGLDDAICDSFKSNSIGDFLPSRPIIGATSVLHVPPPPQVERDTFSWQAYEHELSHILSAASFSTLDSCVGALNISQSPSGTKVLSWRVHGDPHPRWGLGGDRLTIIR